MTETMYHRGPKDLSCGALKTRNMVSYMRLAWATRALKVKVEHTLSEVEYNMVYHQSSKAKSFHGWSFYIPNVLIKRSRMP